MPANLPPDYFAAEERFRQAKTCEEKVRILEEMLAIMPKHKGTDHLQADLRAKISRLKKEGGKKKIVARFNPYAVEREDCPQIMLVGPPNSGKSSLLNTLCGAASEVADYPYSTSKPYPGIFRHAGYRFQLVDLPPVMGDSMEGWMGDLLRHADGAILVLDASSEATLNQVRPLLKAIDGANIHLVGLREESHPLGTIPQKAMVALNKIDSKKPEVVELIKNDFNGRFRIVESSSRPGYGFRERICRELVACTRIIRVYTKIPGQKADLVEPYLVEAGVSVIELAGVIHRDLADNFRFARIWGAKAFEGQRVGKEHIIEDGDIVELHA